MEPKIIIVQDIVSHFSDDVIAVHGAITNITVDNVADPQHTTESTLDWVNSRHPNKQGLAEGTIAKAIIVDVDVVYSDVIQSQGKTLIVVNNPRMMMAKIMQEFFIPKVQGYIHPSAIINEDAIIDSTANVGAGCVVGRAKIGAGTVLKPNVVVYDDVKIGSNCLIQAGVVIGTDGLGCMREQDGTLVKFPHLGGVIIGNNVEIGANCQIAKGVLSDTIISDGCKMNGLCFIAHNCILEENVWITGDTMLCGTTHVGKNATIFSNVIVRDQAHIGACANVGMGSVVTKDIPAGETWVGNPAHKLDKK